MAEPYASPRRFPCVKVLGNVTREVSPVHDVNLLDLSEGGARLEHAGGFALNAICPEGPGRPLRREPDLPVNAGPKNLAQGKVPTT